MGGRSRLRQTLAILSQKSVFAASTVADREPIFISHVSQRQEWVRSFAGCARDAVTLS
jgi:hypothetical protein